MLTIDKVIMNQHANYTGALEDLKWQGVKHLGWLNAGITLPNGCNWEKFYSNKSGSSCLYVDRMKKLSYSVDMGD